MPAGSHSAGTVAPTEQALAWHAGPGLRDHDRVADLIVAQRSIDRSAIRENLIF